MFRLIFFLFVFLMGIETVSAEVYAVKGFPQNTGASIFSDLVAADLDSDGQKEIIVAPDNRMVYAFEPDGSLFFKYTAGISVTDPNRKPAVTDLDGDGMLEIVVYGNPGADSSYLHYLNSSGEAIEKVPVGMNILISSPVVTENNIVLVGVAPENPPAGNGNSGVYAFDGSGKYLWYLDIGWVDRYSTIAVGDIDGDGNDEAGVVIDNGVDDLRLVIMKVERSKGWIIWEKNEGSRISGVVFEDIDNDGKKDVIIGSENGVFVWNGTGSLIWNNGVPSTTHSVPVVGDIDGNGIKDIVIGSDWQNKLYAISNGSIMPGFPVSTVKSVWSRPALGDLDGDGRMDIAAGDYGGYVYAWDSSGTTLPGFPFIPAFDPFMSGGLIDDVDNDGTAELIMGSYNGNVYAWTMRQKDFIPPVTADNMDDLWHNDDVWVHLSASDDIFYVGSTYYTLDGTLPTTNSSTGNDILVTGEGIHEVKYFSMDNAGNKEAVNTAYVKIDKTPPSSFIEPEDGWYNSEIEMNLIANDTLSGIAAVSYKIDGRSPEVSYHPETNITISSEGVHKIEHFSMDNAGNSEPVRESVIKLDLTPPEIRVNSPVSENYLHSDIITLNFSGSDELSGIFYLSAGIDGMPVSNLQEVDMLDLSAGHHELIVEAVDNAGNNYSRKINFNVTVNIDSLIALNNRAVNNGWISNEETARSLSDKLDKTRQKIEAGQKRSASSILKAYINEIEAEAGKTITAKEANVLKTEAAYAYISVYS